MTTKHSSRLVKSLLTENRFWTFWKSDWSEHINVFWAGSIKWSDIMDTMRLKLGEGFMYERQVCPKEPDIKFL